MKRCGTFKLSLTLVPVLTPVSVWAAPFTPPAATGILSQQCYSYVPKVEKAPEGVDANALPVYVDSDSMDAQKNSLAKFIGNVQIRQGVRKVDADYAELEQSTRDVYARGHLYFNDGQVTMTSPKSLKSNLTTENSEVLDATFQVHGSPTRGSAKQANVIQGKDIAMQQAVYTTCPPDAEMWQLKADRVDIKDGAVFGEAWGATFWLKDIPIGYTPYINFPVKDERKSGLLYPTYSESDDLGTEITQPIYWNIAPNYDATITPRFMSARGLMLQTEFRYLPNPQHSGIFYFENLGEDEKYDELDYLNDYLDDGHRYLINSRHTSRFLDNALTLSVDYTKVRNEDYNYFNDFDPSVGTQVDDQLQQSFRASYNQPNWNLSVESRTYQILLANALLPHEMKPRIDYNYYHQNSWYDFSFNTEMTDFGYSGDAGGNNQSGERYTAKRIHIEPNITIPLFDRPGYYLNSQFKLMYTHYQQQLPDQLHSTDRNHFSSNGGNGVTLEEGDIERTLPSVRLRGGAYFDRPIDWFKGAGTQTLEPEFQYLYVPYENQDAIGIYDTTTTRQDYYSLFSDTRFAGLDRIGDANRVTLGLKSSIYDNNGDERLRIAVAQALELEPVEVRLYPTDEEDENTRSLFSFEADSLITDRWLAHAGIQYDTYNNEVDFGSAAIEYNAAPIVTQLNYRFIRDGNIDLEHYNDRTYTQDLSQLGLVMQAPIDQNWHLYGGYYYDTQQDIPIDRMIGVKYDSCCWSVTVGYEWQNEPNNVDPSDFESERTLTLMFEMKGFASVGTGNDGPTMNTELLPYVRPFNLKGH